MLKSVFVLVKMRRFNKKDNKYSKGSIKNNDKTHFFFDEIPDCRRFFLLVLNCCLTVR